MSEKESIVLKFKKYKDELHKNESRDWFPNVGGEEDNIAQKKYHNSDWKVPVDFGLYWCCHQNWAGVKYFTVKVGYCRQHRSIHGHVGVWAELWDEIQQISKAGLEDRQCSQLWTNEKGCHEAKTNKFFN